MGMSASVLSQIKPVQKTAPGFRVDNSAVKFRYRSLEEAFPAVDPGVEPYGSLVLIQIRQPMSTTAGGIILTDDNQRTEHDNTQVAVVRALGPIAFHNRTEMKPWPEGAWCRVGDFVRVPKYQGDRFSVQFPVTERVRDPETGKDEPVTTIHECVFVLFKDLSLLGRYTADPLEVRSFY